METTVYKGYSLMNFDGVPDDRYKRVIDKGVILRHSGNWDLIALNDNVYYIATAESTAGSGWWGDMRHYRKMYEMLGEVIA